jgi:hypothetical protein
MIAGAGRPGLFASRGKEREELSEERFREGMRAGAARRTASLWPAVMMMLMRA